MQKDKIMFDKLIIHYCCLTLITNEFIRKTRVYIKNHIGKKIIPSFDLNKNKQINSIESK